jgi:hypothetical protein
MIIREIRPSRAWYWVAGALAGCAVVWFGLSLILGLGTIDRQIDGFQRVPLPGQGEVSFTEPGGYVLYYEGMGASEGMIPPFTASLEAVSGGESVPISDYSGSLTYDGFGHAGQAVGAFTIDTPGRYLLQTEPQAETAGQAAVAVGRSIGGGIARTLLLALIVPPVLVLGATALAVVVAVRRHQARRWPPRNWDGEPWTEHVADDGAPTVHVPPPRQATLSGKS